MARPSSYGARLEPPTPYQEKIASIKSHNQNIATRLVYAGKNLIILAVTKAVFDIELSFDEALISKKYSKTIEWYKQHAEYAERLKKLAKKEGLI